LGKPICASPKSETVAAHSAGLLPSVASGEHLRLPTFVSVIIGVLLASAALTPVLRYYGVVFGKAVNVPVTDDYDTGLLFIRDYTSDTATLTKKLGLLFAQYNEHRIAFVRLAFLADYVLFGQLNFRHVSLLGNAALLLILTLLFQASFTQIRFP